MNRKSICCAVAALLFGGVAGCERHDWEETRGLHQPHHGGGHGEAGGHHEDHGDHSKDGASEKAGEAPGGAAEKADGPAAPEAPAKPVGSPKGEARDLGVQ